MTAAKRTNAHGHPSVVILVPWFGRWPEWTRFFLESCRWNPTIDWVLITDCAAPDDLPPNVAIERYTFEGYRDLVSARLGIACRWDSPYKICDLRPAAADIHPNLITGYDLWGYGDIDVIYGDIRAIYTDDVLAHDIISSHAHITAGHLTLIRNTPRLNRAYRRVRGWHGLLARPEHRGFDEFQWSHLFTRNPPTVTRSGWGSAPLWSRLKQRLRSPFIPTRTLFVERHSTALYPLPWIDGGTRYPAVWYWREGKLTAEGAGDRQFLYLHFTHWQSDRWVPGGRAAWQSLDRLDKVGPGRPKSFTISVEGFKPAPA